MTYDEMMDLYDSETIKSSINGDNLFQGMQILSKYIDTTKERIIGGATHDEVWGPDLTQLEKANITVEDFTALLAINWHIDKDSECIACFV